MKSAIQIAMSHYKGAGTEPWVCWGSVFNTHYLYNAEPMPSFLKFVG